VSSSSSSGSVASSATVHPVRECVRSSSSIVSQSVLSDFTSILCIHNIDFAVAVPVASKKAILPFSPEKVVADADCCWSGSNSSSAAVLN
jgi:hypothetical protein